jgi:hypothetical protein
MNITVNIYSDSAFPQRKCGFQPAMFASMDGASSGYVALAPSMLAQRHVSPPSILDNDLLTSLKSCSGWPSSAKPLARMDGRFPECMAETPSTSRWASLHRVLGTVYSL